LPFFVLFCRNSFFYGYHYITRFKNVNKKLLVLCSIGQSTKNMITLFPENIYPMSRIKKALLFAETE